MCRIAKEEGKLCGRRLVARGTSQSYKAELERRMTDLDEEARTTLKVIKAHQGPPVRKVLEEELGGVVSGDARGDDEPSSSARGEEGAVQLGKDGVGVDVAAPTEGEAASAADEGTFAVSLPEGGLEGGPEVRVLALEGLDQFGPCGSVRSVRNTR